MGDSVLKGKMRKWRISGCVSQWANIAAVLFSRPLRASWVSRIVLPAGHNPSSHLRRLTRDCTLQPSDTFTLLLTDISNVYLFIILYIMDIPMEFYSILLGGGILKELFL